MVGWVGIGEGKLVLIVGQKKGFKVLRFVVCIERQRGAEYEEEASGEGVGNAEVGLGGLL
jgi:hypothetical protein